MSGKSRHVKGKHLSRSKRGKIGQRLGLERRQSPAIAPHQQSIDQTSKPLPRPRVSAPSASASTPMVKPSAAVYPYITTELRRIGILAGIMLAILVVLALVLS